MMPDSHEERVEPHGPYQDCRVTVDGWVVSYLEGMPVNGGRIDLALDGRYGLLLTVEEAQWIVPFIADAIAIAPG